MAATKAKTKAELEFLKKQIPLFAHTVLNGPTGPERVAEIQEKIKECRSCNLCLQRKTAVCGAGRPEKPVLGIVVDAPSQLSNLTGVPVIGAEAAFLDTVLEWFTLPRAEQFVVPVLACHSSSEIKMEHLIACRAHLMNQLRAVSPQYILTFGINAARSVFNEMKKTDKQIQSMFGVLEEVDGFPVMPTYSLDQLVGSSAAVFREKAHEHLRRVHRKLRAKGVIHV
jgi:uracil-DNA glycosylase family 4